MPLLEENRLRCPSSLDNAYERRIKKTGKQPEKYLCFDGDNMSASAGYCTNDKGQMFRRCSLYWKIKLS